MKSYIIGLLALIVSTTGFAQKIVLKGNIIYRDGIESGVLKINRAHPLRCAIINADGENLLTIHCSKIDVKGLPGYIISFPDGKQAMAVRHSKDNQVFIKEILRYNFIQNDTVNVDVEKTFVAAHPLPAGYIDVDQLVDY